MILRCFLFVIAFKCTVCFDLSSISSAASALGSGIYNSLKDNTLCRIKECCTNNEIPADFEGLRKELNEKVYGQHLVIDTVIKALMAHWDSPHAQKPLTLSFHGWPGGGKNYVSNIIMKNFYKRGSASAHVHQFIGRNIFTLNAKSDEYKEELYEWIKGNVTRCPYQLFVFDEVDKMPPDVLNAIKPLIDYRERLEHIDYRKSVFIFLSNTGSKAINNHYYSMWQKGIRRQDIRLSDFEKIISTGIFNEEGGFHHSDTIKSNLIDHYVPFLPMELSHVKACITYEFRIRGVNNPSSKNIEDVLSHIDWEPAESKLFSRTGCKRLSQKVAFIVQSMRMHDEM